MNRISLMVKLKGLLAAAVVLGCGSAFAQNLKMRNEFNGQPVGGAIANYTPKLQTHIRDWSVTGTRPDAYEVGCDHLFSDDCAPILRTKMFAAEPFGMASITHTESAVAWRGQRVEFVANLKAGRIDGWAGVWMRIDDAEGKVLSFDNMQNRPVQGTKGFEFYRVVLDVPPEAAHVTYGVFLHGPGALFIHEVKFEKTNRPSTDLVAPLRAQAEGTSVGFADQARQNETVKN